MNGLTWFLFIVSLITAFAVGVQFHIGWTELRHDCMPHDPKRCREITTRG